MSQVHIVHANPDFTHPDWLPLVFCGLHELNEGDRHLFKAATVNEQAESASDSLRPRCTVVAITFLPPAPLLDRSKPGKFLLAQKSLAGVPSDVRNQLIRIVAHIRRARLLYVKPRPAGSSLQSSPLILPPATPTREALSPLEAELYDCEISIIWYSWRKIERRLVKRGFDVQGACWGYQRRAGRQT
ncbi:hypothetical protein K466DRAFT_122903 [Polyporus arcularius HHB13444]|uniref:Uncharacterized protein n=1 Tax=Polyporus arcularius HHB13444 TaxID=1314778 RepID=A0A5C3PC70_9APHY|nr:hypothetical protein K466DRAFT_122903 [Polyporus arcularius HHB13444]